MYSFVFFRSAFNLFRVALFGLIIFNTNLLRAQFTAGNLVVLQAGDGSIPLANTGNRIVLKEFTTLGVPAFSVPVSSTINPLVIGGTATSEGMLSLSSNGKYLVFGGYATNLPYGSSLSGATAATLNRGVGIVNAAGNYSRVAVNASFYSGSNIRGAASDGISNYWSSGGSSGTGYFGTASSSVIVQNSITNTRYVSLFSGNLYFSTGSGTQGIYRIGTGFPVTSGQSNSLIINTSASGSGSASGFAFYFNPAQTICYVADDRTSANGGGIQKWTNSNGAWSLAYVLNVGGTSGARGVVADFSGNNPLVYATTDEGSSNRLVAINDGGSASTATTLATATINTIFRGLAFAPYCSEPQIISVSPSTVCVGQPFVLTPSITGTAPFSYTWTAPNSNTFTTPFVSGTSGVNATYSLSVSNACGQFTATHSIIANPIPVVYVNSAAICPGGTVALTATGAASYLWSTTETTSVINVSPTGSIIYSVVATSSQGCSTVRTASVLVTNSLVLPAVSASICPGGMATLTLSGAYTYTFGTQNPVFTMGTVNVNPVNSTTYNVTGSAPGCAATASGIAQVFINPLPTITVNSASICAGSEATLSASGGMNYSWSSGQTGPQVLISPAVNTSYTVSGVSAEGCAGSATAEVIVNTLPTATLTVPAYSICINGGPQTLTGTPQGGFFFGNAVGGNQFIPSSAGIGTVVLQYKYTDGNNCSATDSKTVTVISCTFTAIDDLINLPAISLYPVPAQDDLIIKGVNSIGPFTIEITDSRGMLIKATVVSGADPKICVSDLAKGIYLLNIKGFSSRIFKFIKD